MTHHQEGPGGSGRGVGKWHRIEENMERAGEVWEGKQSKAGKGKRSREGQIVREHGPSKHGTGMWCGKGGMLRYAEWEGQVIGGERLC